MGKNFRSLHANLEGLCEVQMGLQYPGQEYPSVHVCYKCSMWIPKIPGGFSNLITSTCTEWLWASKSHTVTATEGNTNIISLIRYCILYPTCWCRVELLSELSIQTEVHIQLQGGTRSPLGKICRFLAQEVGLVGRHWTGVKYRHASGFYCLRVKS